MRSALAKTDFLYDAHVGVNASADSFGNAIGNSIIAEMRYQSIPAEIRNKGEDWRRWYFAMQEAGFRGNEIERSFNRSQLTNDDLTSMIGFFRNAAGTTLAQNMYESDTSVVDYQSGVLGGDSDQMAASSALQEYVDVMDDLRRNSNEVLDNWNAIPDNAVEYWIQKEIENPGLAQHVVSTVMGTLANTVGAEGGLNLVAMVTNSIGAVADASELALSLKKLESIVDVDSRTPENPVVLEVLRTSMELASRAEQKSEGVLSRLFLKQYGKKLQTASAGSREEYVAVAVLSLSGLFSNVNNLGNPEKTFLGGLAGVGVRNKSDNGVDVLVQLKYGPNEGKWIGFEVKATQQTGVKRLALSKEQNQGADTYIRKQVSLAKNGFKPFTDNRSYSYQATREFAAKVFESQGDSEYKGFVIQVSQDDRGQSNYRIDKWSSNYNQEYRLSTKK